MEHSALHLCDPQSSHSTREGDCPLLISHFAFRISFRALAQTLSDGSTLCSGRFGLIKFDANGKKTWSFSPEDAAPHFPLLIAVGTVELFDGRLLVVNSDWHYQEPNENRVQLFITDSSKNISWTLPVTAFEGWKRGEIEPKTGLLEHRAGVIQLLGPDIP